MKSFIEEYLQNPAQAIADARQAASTDNWYDNIDEEIIYSQLASPEFKLFEAIVLAPEHEERPKQVRVSA